MIPTPWILYTLALILHLPLLSIAFPTDLAPRDSTPSLTEILAKDCPHHVLTPPTVDNIDGQCKAVPWDHLESIVSLDNTGHGNLVIVIETTMGLVLCFIPPKDLNQMYSTKWKSIDDSQYLELFTKRLLGTEIPSMRLMEPPTDGQLMKKLNQMLSWQTEGLGTNCLPPFEVLHLQIAAPGTISSLYHTPLVEKMVKDLRTRLKARFGQERSQPDWQIPVYGFKSKESGNIVIWKSLKAPSEAEGSVPLDIAKLWIENAYGANGNPVADMELNFPVQYHGQSNVLSIAFVEIFIQYPLKGRIFKFDKGPKPPKPPLFPMPPKPISQLRDELSNPEISIQNAKETKWIKYDDEISDIRCDDVPWSDNGSGSLLGSTNEGMSPLLMIQTSAKFIMCYIPNSKWKDLQQKWTSYQMAKTRQNVPHALEREYQSQRDQLLQSLQAALGKVGENHVFYGGQLWTDYVSSSVYFKSFFKDVLIEASTVLRFVIAPYLTTRLTRKIDNPGYWDSAMWLPPSTMQGTEKNEVWIWKMTLEKGVGLHAKPPAGTVRGKSELARLDLATGQYIDILPEAVLD